MARSPIAIMLAALVLAACGQASPAGSSGPTGPSAIPQAHPQAVEPLAGAAPAQSGGQAPVAGVSIGTNGGSLMRPLPDPIIRQDLAASGLAASLDQATLTPDLLALAPINAPPAVQEVIAAGNQIARLPYRYGGGHVTYEDNAYDCSGSISFVFEAAHLLRSSVVSGSLMNWGDPGPGKWITVFANAGHTFMYVAGLRFDTVALAETGSRWSDHAADESDLSSFAVRHPPGL